MIKFKDIFHHLKYRFDTYQVSVSVMKKFLCDVDTRQARRWCWSFRRGQRLEDISVAKYENFLRP